MWFPDLRCDAEPWNQRSIIESAVDLAKGELVSAEEIQTPGDTKLSWASVDAFQSSLLQNGAHLTHLHALPTPVTISPMTIASYERWSQLPVRLLTRTPAPSTPATDLPSPFALLRVALLLGELTYALPLSWLPTSAPSSSPLTSLSQLVRELTWRPSERTLPRERRTSQLASSHLDEKKDLFSSAGPKDKDKKMWAQFSFQGLGFIFFSPRPTESHGLRAFILFLRIGPENYFTRAWFIFLFLFWSMTIFFFNLKKFKLSVQNSSVDSCLSLKITITSHLSKIKGHLIFWRDETYFL